MADKYQAQCHHCDWTSSVKDDEAAAESDGYSHCQSSGHYDMASGQTPRNGFMIGHWNDSEPAPEPVEPDPAGT